MTWAAFVTEVENQMAVEGTRRGLSTFRAKYMRNAVVDLQRYIRGYREGNTTLYTTAEMTDHGQAQLAEFPDNCIPKALYLYSADADLDDPLCYRYRLQFYPWNQRQDMICGKLNFTNWLGACCSTAGCPPVAITDDQQAAWLSKAYVYTFSPMARNFLIYPKLTASTRLLFVYDGFAVSFNDAATVPFPVESAEAVAMYILARVARTVDKDFGAAKEYERLYNERRLSLFRDFREKFDLEPEDEEYDAALIAPPTNFSEFGAQSIPFLRNITSIAGSTATALEFITTASLDLPTTIMILIGGVLQIWTLEASTEATAVGRQRGLDYNATTNARSWVQLT